MTDVRADAASERLYVAHYEDLLRYALRVATKACTSDRRRLASCRLPSAGTTCLVKEWAEK